MNWMKRKLEANFGPKSSSYKITISLFEIGINWFFESFPDYWLMFTQSANQPERLRQSIDPVFNHQIGWRLWWRFTWGHRSGSMREGGNIKGKLADNIRMQVQMLKHLLGCTCLAVHIYAHANVCKMLQKFAQIYICTHAHLHLHIRIC